MKRTLSIVLLFVAMGGCSTHKTLHRQVSTQVKDTVSYHSSNITGNQVDSLATSMRKRLDERADNSSVVIERGSAAADPYQITAAFTLDTSAKGDTLRLVSQENDQVKFQVFYDRKTNQAVAQIQGKGGNGKKMPFEKITITNATVSKSLDSSGSAAATSRKQVSSATVDSGRGGSIKAAFVEDSSLVRKQTGISNIVWGIVAILVCAVVVVVVLRKRLLL